MARCLILVMEGFADDEVEALRGALPREGHDVVLVGPQQGQTVTGAAGAEVRADRDPLHLDLNRAHVAIVPGGAAAAEALVATPSMVNVVYSVVHKGRLVAAAGAGVRLLPPAATQKPPNPVATGTKIVADNFLEGRRVTGDPAAREELEKAGARFVDRPVVAHDPVVTARSLAGPHLDRFLAELLPLLAKAERPVTGRIL